jgi:hypothetical protein
VLCAAPAGQSERLPDDKESYCLRPARAAATRRGWHPRSLGSFPARLGLCRCYPVVRLGLRGESPNSGDDQSHDWRQAWVCPITVWPAFAARRVGPRPPILSVYGSAAVTAVFVGLLGWLFIETQGGSLLGLAERLTSSLQTSWPFVVAVADVLVGLPSYRRGKEFGLLDDAGQVTAPRGQRQLQ